MLCSPISLAVARSSSGVTTKPHWLIVAGDVAEVIDAAYRRGLARLFDGDYEPLEVIKLKDVLQSLEGSCNAVEDVSDVVESILVKNS